MTDPPQPEPARSSASGRRGAASGSSCPTYKEAENIGPIAAAILEALPGATLLVVDDGSPDGTGRLADEMAVGGRAHPGPPPLRRSRASAAPISTASRGRSRAAPRSSSRWTPTSATTRPCCPTSIAPGRAGRRRRRHRLALRAAAAGSWTGALGRRVISRGGSVFARTVLRLGPRDLTGGFKAWRAVDPGRGPVRRRPRRRLRLPDRDDVPRGPGRGAHRRGADHVPRPTRRPEQDVAADHRRGAGGRGPAPRRGAARPPSAAARRADDRPGGPPPDALGRGTLGSGRTEPDPSPGVRVVLDARPLQEPERAPLTAAYLDGLLGAFDAEPVDGESFAFLLRSDLDDPTPAYANLTVVGRRQLPPTHLLRSAAMTVDPFLLRGASLGAAWRADRGGAAGALYHTAGAGPLPIASGLPIVATLLDLAPVGAAGGLRTHHVRAVRAAPARPAAARRGRGDRCRTGGEDRRASPAPPPPGPDPGGPAGPEGVVRPGWRAPWQRTDRRGRRRGRRGARAARADRSLPRLSRPLRRATGPRHAPRGARVPRRGRPPRGPARRRRLAAAGPPAGGEPGRPGVAGARRRAAGHRGVPRLCAGPGHADGGRAARAAPGRPSCPWSPRRPGWPRSRRSPAGRRSSRRRSASCPEIVGDAGVLVEPRDPDRLATALRAIWADDRVHGRLAAAAKRRATKGRRTWAEVAAETRAVYAEVGRRSAEVRLAAPARAGQVRLAAWPGQVRPPAQAGRQAVGDALALGDGEAAGTLPSLITAE